MRAYQSNGDPSTQTEPRDEFEAFEIVLRTMSEHEGRAIEMKTALHAVRSE